MSTGVVSFDLDGTLWDFGPMMDAGLAGAIEALERHRPALSGHLTVADLHRHRRLVGHMRTGTLEELRVASLRSALSSLGHDEPELAEWMSEALLQARAERVALHDDVQPAVQALLAAGHMVGAITNGNFPFERLEMAGRFSFIVHAEQVGAPKPAPEPFARAVEIVGRSPSRWVHVGDDLEIDVDGAQRFGMRAVWLNRDRLPPDPLVRPDAELSSLDGLPEAVALLLADR